MKIIKRGKLPKPQQMIGICSNCGCKIQVNDKEVEWEEDRGQDYAVFKCPTLGCVNNIYCEYFIKSKYER